MRRKGGECSSTASARHARRERGLAPQGAVCSASCREQGTFGKLDLPLFALRKHFLSTSVREEPVSWHAASACQLCGRMVVGKESRGGNFSPQSRPAAERNCLVHPTQETLLLTFVSGYGPFQSSSSFLNLVVMFVTLWSGLVLLEKNFFQYFFPCHNISFSWSSGPNSLTHKSNEMRHVALASADCPLRCDWPLFR